MVDPVSDEERRRTMLYAKVALTVLVGASAGLITSQGDTTVEVTAAAVVVGLVLGAALAWYLLPDGDETSPTTDRRSRR
jgi:uncharacterized membrane protein YccC